MKIFHLQNQKGSLRFLAVLLLVTLLLCCLLPFSACNKGGAGVSNDDTPCAHRDANDDGACDKCGNSYTDQADLAAPHTHAYGDWVVFTAATCTKKGEERKNCSCGEFLTRELAPTGEHLYGTNDLCTVCYAPYEDIGLVLALQNGTYAVTGYTGSAGEVVIPAQYKGIAVTSIRENAFMSCNALTSVTIPSSITTIGRSAFYYCRKLEKINYNAVAAGDMQSVFESAGSQEKGIAVVIGPSVTKIPKSMFSAGYAPRVISVTFAENSKCALIDGYAFQGCHYLTSITLPASVTEIASLAFNSCSSLATLTFEQGSKLTTIGTQVFSGCQALASVELPESLLSMGDFAFSNCTTLSSVTFGQNSKLTTIGGRAFNGCASLAEISIPQSVLNMGASAFENCKDLIKKEGKLSYVDKWVVSCETNATSVTLRENTVGFATNAFNGCRSLASITLPATLKSIDEGAFRNCSALTSISIPAGTTYIGKNAFTSCTALKTVFVPSSVTVIADSAFSYCSALTTLTFGQSSKLSSIGKNAFFDCKLLTDFAIPAGVTEIGPYAFCGCRSLTALTLPEGITAIAERAFESTGLTSIVIPKNVTRIDAYAFLSCNKLASVTIPTGVTHIGANAFKSCGLVSLTIPASVVDIDQGAFQYCTYLASLTFAPGSTLTHIGSNAFMGTGLTSAVIPASVTAIDPYAFNTSTPFTSAVFENTVGWRYAQTAQATSSSSISADSLSDPVTAATYLRSTYGNRYWIRT